MDPKANLSPALFSTFMFYLAGREQRDRQTRDLTTHEPTRAPAGDTLRAGLLRLVGWCIHTECKCLGLELVPLISRSTYSMHPASFAYRISTAGPRPPHGEENSAGARHSTEQPAGPLLTPLPPPILTASNGPFTDRHTTRSSL